jgi:hypothetical protein
LEVLIREMIREFRKDAAFGGNILMRKIALRRIERK